MERQFGWIREKFLYHTGLYERRIIHGHSVTEENLGPEPYPNRIAMDSGAYRGGPLSAVRIASGEEISFLCAFGNDDDPIEVERLSEASQVMDYETLGIV